MSETRPHGRILSRILHVDDEPDVREVVRLALGMIGGFTVESCASGPQAIERAPLFQPDVILLDVMMPGMSGPETLAELRAAEHGGDTPVIFMTAKTQVREVEELHALGAVGVITKPFDPLRVSEQINRIWASHAGA